MVKRNHASAGHVNVSMTAQSSSDPSNSLHVDSNLKFKQEALLQQGRKSKEVGNTWYAEHRFRDALHAYRAALKFYPDKHEETAVLHSNSAACLLQIEPVDYQAVISECSAALEVKPEYIRALVRRAKGFLGLEKVKEARQDVLKALQAESGNEEAIQLLKDIEKKEKTLKSKKKKKKGCPVRISEESKLVDQKPSNLTPPSMNGQKTVVTLSSPATETASPQSATGSNSPGSSESGSMAVFPLTRASQEPPKQDEVSPQEVSPQGVSSKEGHTGVGPVTAGAQVEAVEEGVVEEVTPVPHSTKAEEETTPLTVSKAEGHASEDVLDAVQSDALSEIQAEIEEKENLCFFVEILRKFALPCLR